MWLHGSSQSIPTSDVDKISGKALEPLSMRDMWILERAITLVVCHIPVLNMRPKYDRESRYVLDWLHIRMDVGKWCSYPHWCHTSHGLDGYEYDNDGNILAGGYESSEELSD